LPTITPQRHAKTLMQARMTHVWRPAEGGIVVFEQFTDTLLVGLAMQD
jgi:hypothetical protein